MRQNIEFANNGNGNNNIFACTYRICYEYSGIWGVNCQSREDFIYNINMMTVDEA